MNKKSKIYKIITNAGYYYAVPPTTGRYGRFSEKYTKGWLFCKYHANENLPWMKEQNLDPRLVLVDNAMFCNQCDVNRRRG